MGITGLIPFLKPASRPVKINEYAGCTVAVDSYCWLHKGAIACAEKLVRGDDTDVYVNYCIKYVEMLLSNGLKPILVFDGRHLPAKADTEKSRRERRENNKKRAADLLRQDRPDEARNVMKACIDITPQMAFSLIKRCRNMGVDCIVAPYEADAQLAYLNLSGIAHLVITEDSDLLLFGCERVLFKLDLVGNGLLIEQSKLPLAMKVDPGRFSLDKFRHMCILSGCDYLASLPGIGLSKACKFINRTAETNISRALTKLGAHLNMSKLVVSRDYREKFLIAESMFKHQLVFDPISRKVVPLTPVPPEANPPVLETFPEETSYQLALGNLNPFSLEKFDDWDPDSNAPRTFRTTGWNKADVSSNSIWSKSYVKPKPIAAPGQKAIETALTHGKVVIHPSKKSDEQVAALPSKKQEIQALRERFGVSSPPAKKGRFDPQLSSPNLNKSVVIESSDPEDETEDLLNETSIEDDILGHLDLEVDEEVAELDDLIPTSPVLVRNKFVPRNKFSCSKSSTSQNKNEVPPRSIASSFQTSEENIVCSRYFNSSQDSNCENQPITLNDNLKIGRLTEEEFDNELDRINCGRSDDNRKPQTSPAPTQSQHSKSPGVHPPATNLIDNPLAEISRLSRNMEVETQEQPSLLARLDKMSKLLSENSGNQSTTPTSNFKWKKKEPVQRKIFSSSPLPKKPPAQKSRVVAKSPGLSKNKKNSSPLSTTLKLESFGFKSKPKMTL